jgi:hypothetical protein
MQWWPLGWVPHAHEHKRELCCSYIALYLIVLSIFHFIQFHIFQYFNGWMIFGGKIIPLTISLLLDNRDFSKFYFWGIVLGFFH